MSRTLELDMDTAERITLLSLRDHYKYLKEELRAHIEEGQYLHEDDVLRNHQLIYCLKKVIAYYGGSVV
jgi:hypothetical protein